MILAYCSAPNFSPAYVFWIFFSWMCYFFQTKIVQGPSFNILWIFFNYCLSYVFPCQLNGIFQNVMTKICISCYNLRILKIPVHHMREQTKYSRRVSVSSILGLQRILTHILTPVLLLYAVLNALGKAINETSQTKCGGEGGKCVSGFYGKWRIGR